MRPAPEVPGYLLGFALWFGGLVAAGPGGAGLVWPAQQIASYEESLLIDD